MYGLLGVEEAKLRGLLCDDRTRAGSATRSGFIRTAVRESRVLRVEVARYLRISPSAVTWHLRRKN